MFTDPHIGFYRTLNLGLRLRALVGKGSRGGKQQSQPYYRRGPNGKARRY